MSLFQDLRRLIAEVLGVPESEIDESFNIESCDQWDSLSHMGLVTAIEQQYSVELTMDDIVDMTSIEAIVTRLSELV